MEKEWLNDEASDFSVARRVLCCNHPLEPEMWLTLAGKQFPQLDTRCTIMEISVPVPDCIQKPKFILNYEEASWRPLDMTLLEFLRKSNDEGEIHNHIRRKHRENLWKEAAAAAEDRSHQKDFLKELNETFKEENRARKSQSRKPLELFDFLFHNEAIPVITPLEEFAIEYKCQGEKAIATMTNSRLNDKFYGQWLVLHCPFQRLEEFQDAAHDVMEKVPERYRNFALCLHHAPDFWNDDNKIRNEMELEASSEAQIQTVLAKVAAQRRLIQRYMTGEIPPGEEVDSSASSETAPTRGPKPKLTNSQKLLGAQLQDKIEISMKASQTRDETEFDECVAKARAHRITFASGPPGTGKTHVIHEQIRKWTKRGARVLFALPTGMLASEVRAIQRDIDVDTTWGAFLFDRPIQEATGIMTQYDLIVVDEVSMLTDKQFEHILTLWKHAEQLPALVFLGDFYQLPVMEAGAQRCECSPAWTTNVKTINFYEQVRCKCRVLQKKLNLLRTSIPSRGQLNSVLKNHRAWKTMYPNKYDILELWRRHPATTVVTCTRQGAALINDIAAAVFFEERHKKPLGVVPFDYESNLSNYSSAKGPVKLIKGRLEAKATKVYKGMQVFLTRNISKADDFVNGMRATVQAYDPQSHCLEVVTRTGKRLAIYRVTEELPDGRRVTSLPVRLGYACTIPKVQGMTLEHITVWLDAAGCRAAAYVALSRVKEDCQYLIGGLVGPKHFVPAM